MRDRQWRTHTNTAGITIATLVADQSLCPSHCFHQYLGLLYANQGKLDDAAAMIEAALKKMRRILSEEHPDTIMAMNNLAITLSDQGELDKVSWIRR